MNEGYGDGLDEEFGDLFGGCGVDLAIDADNSAEGGDWIRRECFLIGFEDGCAGSRAAGVGVLDDGDHRLIELAGKLPTGVQVDQIVVAELLALKLLSGGDAETRAVGVERGALVWIFSVAKGLGERQVNAQRGRQGICVESGFGFGFGRVGDGLKRIGDG